MLTVDRPTSRSLTAGKRGLRLSLPLALRLVIMLALLFQFVPFASVGAGMGVQFDDPGLELAVRRAINIPSGPIAAADVVELQELRASFADIESLEGIQHLTSLETLDLAYNLISDLTPLTALKDLRSLNLTGNEIRDIQALGSLHHLEQLHINFNSIQSIAALQHLTELRSLDVSFNPIRSLEPLADLRSLQTLRATDAGIFDLTPLRDVASLRMLHVSDNAISDVTPLRGLANLQNLNLARNTVVNLEPLANLSNLQFLNIDENLVEGVAPLTRLPALRTLWATHNRITNAEPLAELPRLERANLSANQIRTVGPWIGRAVAPQLYLSGNPLHTDTLPRDLVGQIYGVLREERPIAGYIVRLYKNEHISTEHVEVWDGDELILAMLMDRVSFADEWDSPILADGITDVTGNGQANLILIEYTGGAHCCFFVHVFELMPELRLVDTIAGLHSMPRFVDLAGDGTVQVLVHDWTFDYWKTAFAYAPAPRVVLQFDGERFRPAPDHMRAEPPAADVLAAKAKAVRTDPNWESYVPGGGLFEQPPAELWAVMLDLIYSGHWNLAFEFFEDAWPKGVAGRESFARAFVKQLQSSVYWDDIHAELYNGIVLTPGLGE